MRVLVGITTSYESEEQRLRHEYVRAVHEAGGLPVILPMLSDPDSVSALVDLLDALIITGGPAVTSGLVGTLPEDIDDVDPVRLSSDRALLEAVQRDSHPVLGICYGMQLLNAVAGGTIYADVQHQIEGAHVHSAKRGASDHRVTLEKSSLLEKIFDRREISVNSRHIQAIADVSPSYRVAARADDGVIEAIESADGRIMGVQFHPERQEEMRPLFRHFIMEAERKRREGRHPEGVSGVE